jgi:hypothetical protein
LFHPVDVQKEDDIGEGAKGNDEHDEEDLNVFDNLSDHTNESTEWLEQAHPVEQFEPHHEDCDGTVDLQLLVRDEVCDFTTNVECVQGKGTNIDQVPDIKEVAEAPVLDLDHLKNQESDEGLAENDKSAYLQNKIQ